MASLFIVIKGSFTFRVYGARYWWFH